MSTVDDGVVLQNALAYQDEEGNTPFGVTSQSKNGGSQSVGILKRRITSAEILALDTTPIQLLPPPGEGKMYVLSSYVLRLLFGTATYDGDAITIFLFYGEPTNSILASVNLITLFQAGGDSIDWMPGGSSSEFTEQDPIEMLNAPITLFNNSGVPLTGGDSEVLITISYWVVDISA